MFSGVHDAVEAFTIIAPSYNSGEVYSNVSSSDYYYESSKKSMGAGAEEKTWDDSLTSTRRFTIFFWLCISLFCLATCVFVCLQGNKRAQAQSTPSSSKSWFRSRLRSTRTPSHRERSGSIWSKVFSKGQNESNGWSVLRRFASRSKPRAGDVEMQRVRPVENTLHQPGIWRGIFWNAAIGADPTLHSGARGTRRILRPEHSRTNRSRAYRWRAEAERQRLRDAWCNLDVREGAAETFQATPPQSLASEQHLDSPAIPEPITQPNEGRVNDVPLAIYEPFRRAESPTPSILEAAPPTYAQHQDDVVVYLHDYQYSAPAAEEITDVQELPLYEPSWPPVPAPVHDSQRAGFF